MDPGLESTVIVLLVGRSANSTFVLRDHLQKLGYRVSALHSCEAALQCLRQARFDIVLSEFLLSGATTYELLRQLRGKQSSLFFYIPVEDDSWWIPALSEGRDCLGAPAIRSSQLAKTLREIAQGKRSRAQKESKYRVSSGNHAAADELNDAERTVDSGKTFPRSPGCNTASESK